MSTPTPPPQRRAHTDSQYEAELSGIRRLFGQMGSRAAGMVSDSIRALSTRDPALARYVIACDAELDRMEMELDRRCLTVLARRSPVGDDLRLITGVMKAVTDLERVGDLAVNVCERALDLLASPGIECGDDVLELGAEAQGLLERAMSAFAGRDSQVARELYAADRDIDRQNRQAFARLIELSAAHPDQIERIMALSSICRHFERIGDHAVNVGENVVFMVEGEDLRHGG